MALVVYVFATVLMLAAGLEQTLVATGQQDNVIVIRRGSQTEVQSGIDRAAAAHRRKPARDRDRRRTGSKLISKEPVVLINLPKRETGKPSNVVIRGVTPSGPRAAAAGADRRGAHVSARHVGDRRGPRDRARLSRRRARRDAALRVSATGRSSACSTPGAPDSTRKSGATPSRCCRRFGRDGFSAIVFRLADPAGFDAVKAQIESDPRLTLEAKREKRFYAEQSEALSKFICYLGIDDLRDLLDRRHHRRDDHDVCERGVAHRRDRHAARAGILARAPSSSRSWSRRCCWGCSAA